MFYAITAPGIAGVYTNWSEIERIKALYPYPKFRKFVYEADAYTWLKQNKYPVKATRVYNYGNTFDDLYINVKYKITSECVYVSLDCKRVGNVRLYVPDAAIEYKGDKILMRLPYVNFSEESLASHMSVIYNILQMVGQYMDVNIHLEYYSLYYSLASGHCETNRYVQFVLGLMSDRIGCTAFSYDFSNMIGDLNNE